MAIGNPISLTDNVASKIIRVIATSNQTVFTVDGGYRINQIAVFRNGVRLSNNSDFTAVDGVTVTIVNPTLEGDEVLFEIIDDFKVANAIVSTASTQTIFGNLSINGELHVSSISAGILTTGGDGSQLSGVVNSVIAGDNILVSSATGNVTITGLAKTDNINADSLVVTGISTLGIVTGATYYGDGSNLTGLPAVTVSETPPTLPTAGDLWWDSSNTVGTLFVWYEDGDSDQWVEASPSGNDNLYWNRIGTNLSPVNLGDSIGIGTDNPSEKLEINSGPGNTPLKLVSTDSSVYITFEDDATSATNRIGAIGNELVFHTTNTERLRIDNSGRLLLGTFSSSASASMVLQGNSTSTSGASRIYLQRGTTAGSIAEGDSLGIINFADSNGGVFARIETEVDGVESNSDYPGRIVFSTTADDASTPTERMRIDSTGAIVLPDSSPGIQFGTTSTNNGNGVLASRTLDDYEEGTWTPAIGAQSGTFSITYVSQTGYYTKTGNIVTAYFNLTWNSFSNGTGNILYIGTLPYAAVSSAQFNGYISNIYGVNFSSWGNITSSTSLGIQGYSGSRITTCAMKNGSTITDTRGRMSMLKSSGSLRGTVIYNVS